MSVHTSALDPGADWGHDSADSVMRTAGRRKQCELRKRCVRVRRYHNPDSAVELVFTLNHAYHKAQSAFD